MNIKEVYELVPSVKFEISSNWYRVVFQRDENVGENVGEKLHKAERKKKIIELLKQNNTMTIITLSKQLGVNPKTIERDLDDLKDKVTYVGPAKGGHWEVLA